MGIIKNFIKSFDLRNYRVFMDTFGNYFDNQKENYVDWVFQAINVWGNYFIKANFRLYEKNGNNLTEVIDHPFLKLLNKPNYFQTASEFKYKIAPNYGLFGNAYYYVQRDGLGMPMELLPLKTTCVHPISDKRYLDRYDYEVGDKKYEIRLDDMIHLRYPDPENDIEGRAVIKNILNEVQVMKFISSYQNQFYKQGGFLGLSFSTDQAMNTNSFTRLLNFLRDTYGGGVNNSYKIALFDHGVQPMKAAYSIKDADVVGSAKISKDKVLGAFGVPALLLGHSEGLTNSNGDIADKVFTSVHIDPILKNVDDVLTLFVQREYGEDYIVAHDPLAPKDTEAAMNYYKQMVSIGAMTINEIREEEKFNKFPYELADVPLIQGGGVLFNVSTGEAIGTALNQNQPGESTGKEEKSLDVKSDLRDLRYKQYERRFERTSKRFEKVVNKYFDDQLKRIEETLRTKAFSVDEIFNLLSENEILKNIFEDEILKIIQEGFKHASINLESASLFDPKNQFVLNALVNSLSQSESINQTTKDQLIKLISNNINASNQEIAEKVKEEYKGIKEGRTNLIVNTTVTNGLNAGQFYAFKEAGVTKKSWLSQRDRKVRNKPEVSHVKLDGEIVGIDEKFSNGLMYPGDPTGKAEEVVSCRCSMLPEKE